MGDRFLAHGFPRGAAGIIATGSFSPYRANNLIQLTIDGSVDISRGFSGTAVLDESTGYVVGIIVSRYAEKDVRIASMLAFYDILEAWPLLARFGRWRPELDASYRNHWRPKALGKSQMDYSETSYFSGFEEVLREVRRFLDGEDSDPDLFVITGPPGSGKSSILARTLTDLDPVLTPNSTVNSAPVAFAAQAKELTVGQFTKALIRAIDGYGEGEADLVEYIAESGRTFRILIDGLDEAEAHGRRALVAFVRRLATVRGVRLVATVRSGFRLATGEDVVALLSSGRTRTWVLPLAERVLRADLKVLAERRLRDRTDWANHGVTARDLERFISRVVETSFPLPLVATLLCQAAVGTPGLVMGQENGKRAALPTTLDEVVDAIIDVSDRECAPSEAATTRGLLVALAFARGRGFDSIDQWCAVATRLDERGRSYSAADAFAAVDRASPLLEFETEDPITGIRTVHSEVARVLLERTRDRGRAHAKILLALRETSEARLVERNSSAADAWSASGPYALAHAAWHAGEAGQLPDLLKTRDFVLSMESTALFRSSQHFAADEPTAQSIALFYGSWQNRDRAERTSYIELAARLLHHEEVARDFAKHTVDQPWSAEAVMGDHSSPRTLLVDGLTPDEVLATAFGTSEDSSTIWILTHEELSLWDVDAGTSRQRHPVDLRGACSSSVVDTGDTVMLLLDMGRGDWEIKFPILGHVFPLGLEVEGEVVPLMDVAVTVDVDGGLMACAVSEEGQLAIWNVTETGLRLRELSTTNVPAARQWGAPTVVGCVAGPSPILVAVGGGAYAMIDPGTVAVVGAVELGAQDAKLRGMALLSESPIIYLQEGDLLSVRDALSGQLVCPPIPVRPAARAMSVRERNGQIEGAFATGTGVYIWRSVLPASRELSLTQPATSVIKAMARAAPGNAVVTGHESGEVQRWDPVSGEVEVLSPSHKGRVLCLASSTVEGETITLSGGSDGVVHLSTARGVSQIIAQNGPGRVFDGSTGELVGLALDALSGWRPAVRSMTSATFANRPVVATAGDDGLIYVVDLATGLRLGSPLDTGSAILCLRLISLPDDRTIAVVLPNSTTQVINRSDALVFWDINAGRQVGSAPSDSMFGGPSAMDVVFLAGEPLAITGDGQKLSVYAIPSGRRQGSPRRLTLAGNRITELLAMKVRGRAIAVVALDGHVIVIVDVAEMEVLASIPTLAEVTALTWLDDDRFAISTARGVRWIRLLNLPVTGEALETTERGVFGYN